MHVSEPIFFGDGRRLAGWFSPGEQQRGMRRCGVLLCQPVGHEYMCSYRAFRVLASHLANAGFPVLRFDYEGSGDSVAAAENSQSVPTWTSNISTAADELIRRSNCEKIVLVGLRLGASLAAIAAASRTDVDSLVLWSPCTTGRSFLRQTRMLGIAASHEPKDLTSSEDGLEASGFLLASRAVADIARIELDKGIGFRAASILVMTRDDVVATEESLVNAIRKSGVNCEEARYGGHASLMVTPLHSVLPRDAIDTIVHWVDNKYPLEASLSGPARVPSHAAPHTTVYGGTRESVVVFSDDHLVGAVSEPEIRSDNPAVILLNTGSDHRVGPHGMYASLARRWAALGFPVLRFDLTGIGDSDRDERVDIIDSYPRSALKDVGSAIEYMREHRGHSRIILAGICSGGYHAIHSDKATVSAVIAVNPPLYHTAGEPIVSGARYDRIAETRRVLRSLAKPAKWRRLLSGRINLVRTSTLLSQRLRDGAQNALARIARMVSTTAHRRPDPISLFDEGVAIHLIFSERDAAQIYFDHYISSRLKRRKRRAELTVDVVPGADHTFMPVRWQRALAELMTKRLLEHRTQ